MRFACLRVVKEIMDVRERSGRRWPDHADRLFVALFFSIGCKKKLLVFLFHPLACAVNTGYFLNSRVYLSPDFSFLFLDVFGIPLKQPIPSRYPFSLLPPRPKCQEVSLLGVGTVSRLESGA